MKATGIVRRIDDLGRVVIPKELRRTMRLREGAPLEIFTEKDGELIFKKYSPIGELGEFVAGEMLGQPALIFADRPQLALHACVLLESAVLRVDIAVIELLDKIFHIVSPSFF